MDVKDAETLALMHAQYPFATLESHMLVNGLVHLRCARCKERSVPHSFSFIQLCDPCLAEGNALLPRTVPVAEGNSQAATLVMTPVTEGYECRWYKLPGVLPPTTSYISVGDLEFMFGGLYGKDGELIRPLPDREATPSR